LIDIYKFFIQLKFNSLIFFHREAINTSYPHISQGGKIIMREAKNPAGGVKKRSKGVKKTKKGVN